MKEEVKAKTDEERNQLEASMNEEIFNELAKDVFKKINKPKYMKDVFGISSGEVDSKTNLELEEIKKQFNLIDKEINAVPPGGGAATGSQAVPSAKADTSKKTRTSGGVREMVGMLHKE